MEQDEKLNDFIPLNILYKSLLKDYKKEIQLNNHYKKMIDCLMNNKTQIIIQSLIKKNHELKKKNRELMISDDKEIIEMLTTEIRNNLLKNFENKIEQYKNKIESLNNIIDKLKNSNYELTLKLNEKCI